MTSYEEEIAQLHAAIRLQELANQVWVERAIKAECLLVEALQGARPMTDIETLRALLIPATRTVYRTADIRGKSDARRAILAALPAMLDEIAKLRCDLATVIEECAKIADAEAADRSDIGEWDAGGRTSAQGIAMAIRVLGMEMESGCDH